MQNKIGILSLNVEKELESGIAFRQTTVTEGHNLNLTAIIFSISNRLICAKVSTYAISNSAPQVLPI